MIDVAALATAWAAGLAGACMAVLMAGRLWDFAKRIIR